MAKKIFVTATNTNVGKTHTTLALMKEAKKKGLRPAAFKPMETGVPDGVPADGTLLLQATHRLNSAATHLCIDDIVPLQFELPAAPYVANGGKRICFESILEKMQRVEAVCDILFIEGAGGVMVPIEKGLFMADLPKIFDAHTLLVSPTRLGSISDTLSSMEILENRGVNFDLALNLFEEKESFEEITYPYYLHAGIEHFLLPEKAENLLEKLVSS